jgi:hypothetical protein
MEAEWFLKSQVIVGVDIIMQKKRATEGTEMATHKNLVRKMYICF